MPSLDDNLEDLGSSSDLTLDEGSTPPATFFLTIQTSKPGKGRWVSGNVDSGVSRRTRRYREGTLAGGDAR